MASRLHAVLSASSRVLQHTKKQIQRKSFFSYGRQRDTVGIRLLKTMVLSRDLSTAAVVDLDAGQPIPETHPEVLRPGEIMPGVTYDEVASRRKKLMSSLPTGSIVILHSAPVKEMTVLVPYPYRQSADYLYYTGSQQSGGIAVIFGAGQLCMFMPDPPIEGAFWEGRKALAPQALTVFKADRAYDMNDLSKHLPQLLKQSKGVYVDNELPSDSELGQLPAFKEATQEKKVHSIQKHSHEARWIKSPSEINLIRHSAGIACQAFLQTMKVSRTRMHEHLLAATIEYECKIKGAQRMAFPPVVAAGVNSTVIHYSRNDQPVREGEMVLMDAGCEYYGYVSDITRTWSPSGIISNAQKDIYEVVLATFKECLKFYRPGGTLQEIHRAATDKLCKAARELGIIQKQEDYRKINPTSVGHYLGMDVHDCKGVREDRQLVPGVVLTIEPGLYIPVSDEFPKCFQGIGVRIEDEVLITETGNEIPLMTEVEIDDETSLVLTASIPKEINEIEAWLQCCKNFTTKIVSLLLYFILT